MGLGPAWLLLPLIANVVTLLHGMLGQSNGHRLFEDREGLLHLPSIPLISVEPWHHWHLHGDDAAGLKVKDWYGREKQVVGLVRLDGEVFRFLGGCPQANCPPVLQQVRTFVGTTMTELVFESPGREIQLVVRFVSSQFADDLMLLSRPVWHVIVSATSLNGQEHSVQVYIDASAEHATNCSSEKVLMESWRHGTTMKGLRVGTVAQNVLGATGDKFHINWGHFYIGVEEELPHMLGQLQYQRKEETAEQRRQLVDENLKPLSRSNLNSSSVVYIRGGGALENRAAFASCGKLPSKPSDLPNPRPLAVGDKLPVLSVAKDLGLVYGGKESTFLVTFGYDDIESVMYYNVRFKGYWTRFYDNITAAMSAAHSEFPKTYARGRTTDDKQNAALLRVSGGSKKYADLGRIAYRETLGALKVVWNHEQKQAWSFLKEISTNGDMNTVDVIYPASPVLLFHNPELLLRTLVPVLMFANNGTRTPYTKPYSPHEIGIFPLADHNTKQQESMPMENSGNMLLMVLGVLQRVQRGDESETFVMNTIHQDYYHLLKLWADNLRDTLPFPKSQLCTDDFNGRLANNTNLAAKAIVALQAFANMCTRLHESDCNVYAATAQGFAKTWLDLAVVKDDLPHSMLAYGKTGTYSIKYNLVWQLVLGFGDDNPFPLSLLKDEAAFYLSMAKKYGTPLDSRNSNIKLDWLSWAAAMGPDEKTFNDLMEPLYRFIEETTQRIPLSDLYNANNANNPFKWNYGFVDRPVLGAVFARALVTDAPGV